MRTRQLDKYLFLRGLYFKSGIVRIGVSISNLDERQATKDFSKSFHSLRMDFGTGFQ